MSGIEFIRNEVSGIAWDTYDPWGCVKAAQFDIVGAWWVYTGNHLLGFRPGIGYRMNGRTKRLNGAMNYGVISMDDVYHWLKVLNRMENLVVDAGRDY